MKVFAYSSLFSVLLLLVACSHKPQYKVAGADWLSGKKGGTIYDVLAYPITEDELSYFEASLPALEAAAAKYPELWEEISVSDDPALAAQRNAFWVEAGVLGEDIIAINLKLTFLWEFKSTDEPIEDDVRSNLALVEARLVEKGEDVELFETANSMRALLGAIVAHRERGSFGLYAKEKARFDAALDRFMSIGEQ